MPTALIADDEDLSRYTLRKMISSLLPELVVSAEAENGREAVELAGRLKPDLVIMDVRMPGLDGLAAAARILAADPAIRIVIASAHDDFAYAQRAVNLRLSGYLLKPLREEDFLAVVGPLVSAAKGAETPAGPIGAVGTGNQAPFPALSKQVRKLRDTRVAELEREILRFARSGNEEAAAQAVRDLCASWKDCADLGEIRERVLDFALHLRRELGSPDPDSSPFDLVSAAPDRETLERALVDSTRRSTRALAAPPADLLSRARAFLAGSDLSLVTLESTAEALGVSPPHLSRSFRALSGERFLDYLGSLRMEAAKEALSRDEGSVAEIGRRLGYRDPGYFARIFKEKVGVSPGAWRRAILRG